MAIDNKTNSWSWPKLFNVAQNKVALLTNENSVVNRSKLLILTEPTEIYNEPEQGVGLKRHLFKYNNENERAILKDRIREQLRLHEPQCNSDHTQFADGLLFTGTPQNEYGQNFNELNMTVGIETVFGKTVDINLDIDKLDKSLYSNFSEESFEVNLS